MNTEQGDRLLSGVLAHVAQRGRVFLALLRAAWQEYEQDYARYFAGAMIYYALLSLIPLLLLLLSALGLLLRFSELAAGMQQQVLGGVEAAFGAQLRATVEQLLVTVQQESIVATVISLIGLLLTASVLFRHLRLSFRAIWKHAPPLISGPVWVAVRASFLEQAIAYVLVLMGGGLLLAALMLIALAWWLNSLLESLPQLGQLSGWLITVLSPFTLAAITFAFLFRFMPPVPVRWRDVWLAALLCAGAWWAASALLSLYGTIFGSNLSAYGAIGALLAVMLWMNIISQVLFFGAELCKVTATQAR
jgi:membrane protein